VKQIIRQVSPTFDERSYGFGNLVDLLRAAQKEAIVRVERDRQGVIRVFQSANAPAPTATVSPDESSAANVETELEPAADVAAAAAEIGVAVPQVPVATLEQVRGGQAPDEATEPSSEAKAPQRRRRRPATAPQAAAPARPARRRRALKPQAS